MTLNVINTGTVLLSTAGRIFQIKSLQGVTCVVLTLSVSLYQMFPEHCFFPLLVESLLKVVCLQHVFFASLFFFRPLGFNAVSTLQTSFFFIWFLCRPHHPDSAVIQKRNLSELT